MQRFLLKLHTCHPFPLRRFTTDRFRAIRRLIALRCEELASPKLFHPTHHRLTLGELLTLMLSPSEQLSNDEYQTLLKTILSGRGLTSEEQQQQRIPLRILGQLNSVLYTQPAALVISPAGYVSLSSNFFSPWSRRLLPALSHVPPSGLLLSEFHSFSGIRDSSEFKEAVQTFNNVWFTLRQVGSPQATLNKSNLFLIPLPWQSPLETEQQQISATAADTARRLLLRHWGQRRWINLYDFAQELHRHLAPQDSSLLNGLISIDGTRIRETLSPILSLLADWCVVTVSTVQITLFDWREAILKFQRRDVTQHESLTINELLQRLAKSTQTSELVKDGESNVNGVWVKEHSDLLSWLSQRFPDLLRIRRTSTGQLVCGKVRPQHPVGSLRDVILPLIRPTQANTSPSLQAELGSLLCQTAALGLSTEKTADHTASLDSSSPTCLLQTGESLKDQTQWTTLDFLLPGLADVSHPLRYGGPKLQHWLELLRFNNDIELQVRPEVRESTTSLCILCLIDGREMTPQEARAKVCLKLTETFNESQVQQSTTSDKTKRNVLVDSFVSTSRTTRWQQANTSVETTLIDLEQQVTKAMDDHHTSSSLTTAMMKPPPLSECFKHIIQTYILYSPQDSSTNQHKKTSPWHWLDESFTGNWSSVPREMIIHTAPWMDTHIAMDSLLKQYHSMEHVWIIAPPFNRSQLNTPTELQPTFL